MAAGVTGETIHHEDVMEIGRRVERQFTELLVALVPQIEAAGQS
jgi:purine-nucleoside phosphorylase